MFDIHTRSFSVGDRSVTVETGKLARQTQSSVVVSYGNVCVLATLSINTGEVVDVDFVPLSVHQVDRYAAVGRIPGGYIKREGKPSQREILVSRLMDRALRGMIRKNFRYPSQCIVSVLSCDYDQDPDVVSLMASSAALSLCGSVMSRGVFGSCRVGLIDGNFIMNPTLSQLGQSSMDLMMSYDKDDEVVMLELDGDQLDSDTVVKAIQFGIQNSKQFIPHIEDLAERAGRHIISDISSDGRDDDIRKECVDVLQKLGVEEKLVSAHKLPNKLKKDRELAILRKGWLSEFDEDKRIVAKMVLHDLENQAVKKEIVTKERRLDNRKFDEIRAINCEVDFLSRPVHGVALFTRGDTQVVTTCTLGSCEDAQSVDNMIRSNSKDRFLLNYNFLPHSTGETTRLCGVSRRETGHGVLAQKGLERVFPSEDEFPYTVRVVADVHESNGSSSMATVSAASIVLLDSGVPLSATVGGIAMGLIKYGGNTIILSDITGAEDHFGNMDFKIIASNQGITALQIDVKDCALSIDIIRSALAQGRAGIEDIIAEIVSVVPETKQLRAYVPRCATFNIDSQFVPKVIGVGGKTIREICDSTGAKIDIVDDKLQARVRIFSKDEGSLNKAISFVKKITSVPKVGKVYCGKVKSVVPVGCVVVFGDEDNQGAHEGFVHISEVSDRYVERIGEHVSVGQKYYVLLIDDRDKYSLSMKSVDQETKMPVPRQDKMRASRSHFNKDTSEGKSRNFHKRNNGFHKKR